MIWTLSDGTEIRVTDESNGYDIYIAIFTRDDVWNLIDNVLKQKDLTSFTLSDGKNVHEYDDMVFISLHVLSKDRPEDIIRLQFGAGIIEANKRLMKENEELLIKINKVEDKANAYDILVNGQPETEQTE